MLKNINLNVLFHNQIFEILSYFSFSLLGHDFVLQNSSEPMIQYLNPHVIMFWSAIPQKVGPQYIQA